MLDSPPRESETVSWTYVVIGVAVIYATIPVARALRENLHTHLGLEYFLYLTLAGVILLAYVGLRNAGRRKLAASAKWTLAAVGGIYVFYLYQLRDIPEEAIHVLEYGCLGLLVYRALSHRMRDAAIFAAATLVVGMVGIVDEYIQWIVPTRVFDLRDIRTNFVAGALSQVAIAAGLRPALITGRPTPASWGRLCYLTAGLLLLLAAGFLNTPQRIAWYAARVAALSHLADSASMMVEYGYRYADPSIGVFRSRFTLEQLERLDRTRGEAVAKILDRYIGGEGYPRFLERYTVPRDAYAHEAGVHLYRRNIYLDRARGEAGDRARLYLVAQRENRILERYFSRAILYSRHRWDVSTGREVDAGASNRAGYESPVSRGLITRFDESQALTFFTLALMLCLVTGRRLKRAGVARE